MPGPLALPAAPAATSVATGAGLTKAGLLNSLGGSSIAALVPALIQGLIGQGGALRSTPAQGGTASKFTIPQSDVLGLYQFVENKINLGQQPMLWEQILNFWMLTRS